MRLTEILEHINHFIEETGELSHDEPERLAVFINNNYTVKDYLHLVDEIHQWASEEEDALMGTYDSEGDFVERYYSDTTDADTMKVIDGLVVDWQKTWDYAFQYDFWSERPIGQTYGDIWVWRNV